MALGWIGSTTAFGAVVRKAVDLVRPRYRLRLGAAIPVERRPDASESERGFGSGAHSAKLLAGTRHRFSGLSQPRQCGEEVLWVFVTGGPPI